MCIDCYHFIFFTINSFLVLWTGSLQKNENKKIIKSRFTAVSQVIYNLNIVVNGKKRLDRAIITYVKISTKVIESYNLCEDKYQLVTCKYVTSM